AWVCASRPSGYPPRNAARRSRASNTFAQPASRTPRTTPTRTECSARRSLRLLRPVDQLRPRPSSQRGRVASPRNERGRRALRDPEEGDRFHRLRQLRLSGGRPVLIRARARRRRRLASHHRIPRRAARRLGALPRAGPPLSAPSTVSPPRQRDCPPVSDGAAAVVLATADLARRISERPAWIAGIDHRIDSHSLGARDLTSSPSAALAARNAGANQGPVDVAELHAQFSHEELILRRAIGLDNGTAFNPSGGPLCANPIMATGLIRIGEAASRIMDGSASRAVAHASSGPCLQQNLVCVLEARDG